MNNKGFTLVELLATMAILAIIGVIAIPNLVKVMDENKKEKVINDGRTLVSLANYEYSRNPELRESLTTTGTKFTLKELDSKTDLTVDPDGSSYDRELSYVNISKNSSGVVTYCVYLKSANWKLSNVDDCVISTIIEGDNAKNYVNAVKS